MIPYIQVLDALFKPAQCPADECAFLGVPQPTVALRQFHAFSFYYDRALDMGLLQVRRFFRSVECCWRREHRCSASVQTRGSESLLAGARAIESGVFSLKGYFSSPTLQRKMSPSSAWTTLTFTTCSRTSASRTTHNSP